MIQRCAEQTLHRLAKGFPLVCITGPRQSGKTTLSRLAFPDKPYMSLEDPDIAQIAREDPRGLLDIYADGVILDEAQAVPELFKYLKTAVDRDPQSGKFIVTGSQQFSLFAGVSESLAGRAAFLSLLPFSMHELRRAKLVRENPFEMLYRGFYPPLYQREVSVHDWYTQYIGTYIERDVRSIVNVKDLGQFRIFVKMCASRVGQILNQSALARDCGITHNTARAWLSVLETSGILFLLPPWHSNYGKRLVKSPKLYFTDTGLLCRLLGIQNAETLFLHPNRGSIFESFVVSELLKKRLNDASPAELYFWRDNSGTEVDIVYEEGSALNAVEIKSGKTFSPDFIKALDTWRKYSLCPLENCSIVYAGDRALSWKGISVETWDSL